MSPQISYSVKFLLCSSQLTCTTIFDTIRTSFIPFITLFEEASATTTCWMDGLICMWPVHICFGIQLLLSFSNNIRILIFHLRNTYVKKWNNRINKRIRLSICTRCYLKLTDTKAYSKFIPLNRWSCLLYTSRCV